MRPWKLTLSVVSLLVTVSTALPINLLVPFSVPQVLAQTVEERKAEANRLLRQGGEQYFSSQFQAALQSLERALVIYREIGDRSAEGDVLGNLGAAYYDLGNYDTAIRYSQESLVIARETQNRSQEARSLNNLGITYAALGNYLKAIDYYNQSLTVTRTIQYRLGEGQALGNIGSAYRALGDYAKAIEYHQQSLAIFREIQARLDEGKALGNLGSAYNFLGDYAKAIEYHQQYLILAREIQNPKAEGIALGGLASVYYAMGNYDKGVEFYQQYLAIAREIKSRQDEGEALAGLGDGYYFREEYIQAIDYYKQSLQIVQEIGDLAGAGAALRGIGASYYSMGDYSKAIDYYQQSLQRAQKIKDRNGVGAALGNLGIVYRALGNYDKAIEFSEMQLTIARATQDRYQEAASLHNIGNILRYSGKFAAAEDKLLAAIKIWESLRARLGDDDVNKISIFDRKQEPSYRQLQQVLIAQNKNDTALEIAERGRARAFIELLMKRLSPESSTKFEPPISLPVEQIKQIAQAQKATIVEYSIIYDDFKNQGKEKTRESQLYIWVVKPTGEIAFRKVDLNPLWQQQNTSLEDLVTKNLELVIIGARGESNNSTLSNNPPFAPGDLVRLNDDSSNYPAWQVVSVNPQKRTLIVRQPSFSEGTTIERSMADATKVSSPNGEYSNLQQLHKLLIEPIADLLPTDSKDRVIFIPQGALFFVPFPALQDANKKFLIEKHTILTAPSIQVLDLTRQQRQRVPGTAKEVLVAGNPIMPKVSLFPGEPAQQLTPLPAAEQEATEVAQMFKTQAMIGSQATKAAILPQLPKARIIHLATHGLLNDYTGGGVPGAIALAPSNNDNGLLTASEILDLKLNAELVVLSACNTGKGRITGDGVIGLSRSLISAGVPSVVVSLWSVPDAPTASLMTEFYRQMQQTGDKAQALRQAMLTTLQQHPEPKDWAAFTLIGEAK